jgi:large subunit ribosomal protein L23
MHPYEVLLKPVLSEKSNKLREKNSKYVFKVRVDASKQDVKKAVEHMFEGVKVDSITTAVTRGKLKRRGNQVSKTPGKDKRAIVSLTKESKKIPLFEDL